MFYNIVVLKHFAKFTGKHLCWSLFLVKLLALGQGSKYASELPLKKLRIIPYENFFEIRRRKQK